MFEMATCNLITNIASMVHWLTNPLKNSRNITNHMHSLSCWWSSFWCRDCVH